MECSALTVEEFIEAARDFVKISSKLNDGWKLYENLENIYHSFIKKETFISLGDDVMMKAEFVIFYNLSYGVPAISFNIWNSTGVLLSLDEIWQMSFIKIDGKEFFSVITQQEHPIFGRPYFIMHPCHTETLLATFKDHTKNIIVTFLSLITPLIRLNLPLEYGL